MTITALLFLRAVCVILVTSKIFKRGATVNEMTLSEIVGYTHHILNAPHVQTYLSTGSYELSMPKISIVSSCGPLYAAKTYGHSLIEVSSWLLVDEGETLTTLRHECAHILKNKCRLEGEPHGKSYTEALKIVSPTSWEYDKFWHPNATIEEASVLMHPTEKSLLR